MFAINHTTKQILAYKLQAMCASGTCFFPGCHAPNTGGRTCDEHAEYKVHIWSENGGWSICDHCGVSAVRYGHPCCMCLRYSPTRELAPVADG